MISPLYIIHSYFFNYTHRASRDACPAGGRTFRTIEYSKVYLDLQEKSWDEGRPQTGCYEKSLKNIDGNAARPYTIMEH
jgi:hypothetical protein